MNTNHLGIYWDIENCSLPKTKNAVDLTQKIRNLIIEPFRYRLFEFFCSCDITRLPPKLINELHSSGITLAHVPASSKNASDDKIKEQMQRFIDTHGERATIFLISGDVNFAPVLRGYRDRLGIKIILMHNVSASRELIDCADSGVYNFMVFIKDLPDVDNAPQKINQLPSNMENQFASINVGNNNVHSSMKTITTKLNNVALQSEFNFIEVGDIDRSFKQKDVIMHLTHLSSNTGGKVMLLKNDKAIIKFASKRDAERALPRLNNSYLGNNKLSAKITHENVDIFNNHPSIFATHSATNSNEFKGMVLNNSPLVSTGFERRPPRTSQMTATGGAIGRQTVCINITGFPGKQPINEIREKLKSFLGVYMPKTLNIKDGSAYLKYDEADFIKAKQHIDEMMRVDLFPGYKMRYTISSANKNENEIFNNKNQNEPRLTVSGIPGKESENVIKQKLSLRLGDIRPINVTIINGSAAILFFTCKMAKQAQKLLEGFELFPGYKLKASWSVNFRNDGDKKNVTNNKDKQEISITNKGRFIEVSNLLISKEISEDILKKMFDLIDFYNGRVISIHRQKGIAWCIFPTSEIASTWKEKYDKFEIIPGKKIQVKIVSHLPKELITNYNPIVDQNQNKVIKPSPSNEQLKSLETTKIETTNNSSVIKNNGNPIDKPLETKKEFYANISGLPGTIAEVTLKSALENLFKQFKGDVVYMGSGFSIIKFPNENNLKDADILFSQNEILVSDRKISFNICDKEPKCLKQKKTNETPIIQID